MKSSNQKLNDNHDRKKVHNKREWNSSKLNPYCKSTFIARSNFKYKELIMKTTKNEGQAY